MDEKYLQGMRGIACRKGRTLSNVRKEIFSPRNAEMKKIFVTSILFAVFFSALSDARAVEFNARSQSFAGIIRDGRMLSNNRTWVPFYEYVDASIFDIGVKGLSFHISGWGRGDITARTGGGDRGGGALDYGYVQWKMPRYNFDLQGGRQFVFSGPAAMRGRYVDGLRIKSDLFWGIGIEALGGSPIRNSTSGRSGDVVAQGRLFCKWGKNAEAGFSYANARDDGEPDQENVGVDFWIKPVNSVEASLYGYYDLISKGFADAGVNVNYSPVAIPWQFAMSYNYIVPSDLLSRTSIFFVFSDTGMNDLGASATYLVSRYMSIDLGGNWYHYSNDTNAGRVNADINWKYGPRGRHRAAFGIYRLNDFGDGITGARLYTRYFIAKKWSVSGDLYEYLYDTAIRGRYFSFTAVGALNYKLPKGFVLTGAADFSANPYFDADVKGMLKLTYNFGGSSGAF